MPQIAAFKRATIIYDYMGYKIISIKSQNRKLGGAVSML